MVPQAPPAPAPLPPPPVFVPQPPPVPVPIPAPEDFSWADMPLAPMPEPTPGFAMAEAPGLEPLELEPLELEPLSFVPVEVQTPGRVVPVAAPPAPAVVDEELANLLPDIDFQLDYGSPEEAKLAIVDALKHWPGHPELTSRLETAEVALRKLGHEVKPAALEESDFTGSFFDLTDVLGEALLDSGEGEEMHDATNVVEKIQSVEELFDAFREGVEQQVRGDDYDTHYNLGIAYKEMMLIEPAVQEFKKAMRDPERTLECCSMLSICEISQGNLEAAASWLNQGIHAPGFPPEDSIGLRYDLGELLLLQGKPQEAREQFLFVYGIDPDYREVAQKV